MIIKRLFNTIRQLQEYDYKIEFVNHDNGNDVYYLVISQAHLFRKNSYEGDTYVISVIETDPGKYSYSYFTKNNRFVETTDTYTLDIQVVVDEIINDIKSTREENEREEALSKLTPRERKLLGV